MPLKHPDTNINEEHVFIALNFVHLYALVSMWQKKYFSLWTQVLLFIFLIITTNLVTAQEYQLSSKDKKAIKYYNNAASYYKNSDYNEAIESLEKCVSQDAKFIEAWLLLGDAYAEVNSKYKAISAYETAISIDSLFFLPVYYFLANLNYEIGEYRKAANLYTYFARQPSVSNDLLLLTYQRLLFARKATELVENPIPGSIQNIGPNVNTSNDEYINYVNTDKDFMMLTRRTATNIQNKGYKEDLYYASRNDSTWENPEPVNLDWREDMNMGSLNLSADGRSMYFTGCYWPSGQGNCDLYVSHKLGSEWLDPENLGDNINTSTWESQPIISSNGKKLFFASKRKGGQGGSDIWMSVKLKNDNWSPPVNLGDSINSPKDEMAPFLHADGKTLFFASNGHPGLGGYDLFISRQDELGQWSLAANIGYPTNSRYNEINIFTSIDGKRSWISSDRANGLGGMDIYSFDNYMEILPRKIMYVEGIVVDKVTKKPLKAEIQITNLSTSELINTTISDSINGSFLLVVFPGIDYAFNISKTGYLFLSENINLKDSIGVGSVKKQFALSPFTKGNQLIMNNVYFKFNQYELLPSSYIELDKLVEILVQYPTSNIEITGHTDSIGNIDYNMELSMKRAVSVGNYLIKNGIEGKRLEFKAMGSSRPVAPNEFEQGRAKNRRTEISIK
ncbi:MAG: OmpA family protein [Bacteroidetes bacterium]|nr:OmpA family protein [Bacteroidota bacterium]